MLKSLPILCVLALFPMHVFSTHLVGGDITYSCEGYDSTTEMYTYNIILTVYNDCSPANVNNTFFDDVASIGIFNDGTLYENLTINYPGTYTLLDNELSTECVSVPINACVRKAVYEGTVELDFADGGYDVVYQRCCRNWSIDNISAAGNTGMTLHAFIPEPEDEICNSSPVFNIIPPAFLCDGYEFELDFSASDADGDSLVYELCTPMVGATVDIPQPSPPDFPPFANVNWSFGYNSSDPFSTVSGLELDSETGILSGVPDEIGVFAIAFCVSEYRDGVLLSTISRDYQINVYNCPAVVESIFAEQNSQQICNGLEIEFENISTNSDQFFWDFGVEGIESDTSDEIEPSFVFPNAGIYEVMMVAEPYTPCADTSFQVFSVFEPPVIFYNLPTVSCDVVTSYNFEAQGSYSDSAVFQWQFGSFATSILEDPGGIEFPGPGTYETSLTVQSNGCTNTYFGDIVIPEEVVADIVPQSDFCVGLEIDIENASLNAEDYQWIIGDPGEEQYATTLNASASFDLEGVYPVQLIAYNDMACPDTAYAFIEIFPYMMPYFEVPQEVYCFDDHEINLIADGTFQNDIATFEWDFGPDASSEFIETQNALGVTFDEPGSYPVTFTIYENGCEKNYTQFVEIHPNPLANFDILDTNGCMPLSVDFVDQSVAWTELSYFWDFDNGALSIEPNPSNNYAYPGSFYPSLTVSTSDGCIGESTYTMEIPIVVYPLPQANFSIEPNIVNILDPEVYITDMSQSAIDVAYDVSNGDAILTADASYIFSDAGTFSITQTVWNEFGCISKVTGGVEVRGFLFYMPNSFTPNGDGYNDILIPEYTGIKDYLLQVYDRWGQVVFRSTDPAFGWDGGSAEAGVYNYIVEINDLTLFPHHFSGSITLLR